MNVEATYLIAFVSFPVFSQVTPQIRSTRHGTGRKNAHKDEVTRSFQIHKSLPWRCIRGVYATRPCEHTCKAQISSTGVQADTAPAQPSAAAALSPAMLAVQSRGSFCPGQVYPAQGSCRVLGMLHGAALGSQCLGRQHHHTPGVRAGAAVSTGEPT